MLARETETNGSSRANVHNNSFFFNKIHSEQKKHYVFSPNILRNERWLLNRVVQVDFIYNSYIIERKKTKMAPVPPGPDA